MPRKNAWIIRHILTSAGANFDGKAPEVNADVDGIIRLFEREEKGGLFYFDNDLTYDLRRIVLDYKDATSFEVNVRHKQFPAYEGIEDGDYSDVETPLASYSNGSFDVVPPGGEYLHDDDLGRFMLMDLDLELMNDEQVSVYTDGATEGNLFAEVMGRPILT